MIWHSMETAPRDGTEILARYHNDVSWEYRVVWWGPITPNDPYPWRCEYNSYPEGRCTEWTELEPETHASVEDWLGEIENYSSRAERMTLNECHYARTAWQLAAERCEAEYETEISELKRKLDGYQRHLHECEQIAGKALGYPWYKDDQKNFPGATEADGVCFGEHVGDTIVAELAEKYKKTRDALANVIIAYGMGWDVDGVIEVAEDVFTCCAERGKLHNRIQHEIRICAR